MEIFHKSDGFYITTTTVELRNKNVNFQFFSPYNKIWDGALVFFY